MRTDDSSPLLLLAVVLTLVVMAFLVVGSPVWGVLANVSDAMAVGR